MSRHNGKAFLFALTKWIVDWTDNCTKENPEPSPSWPKQVIFLAHQWLKTSNLILFFFLTRDWMFEPVFWNSYTCFSMAAKTHPKKNTSKQMLPVCRLCSCIFFYFLLKILRLCSLLTFLHICVLGLCLAGGASATFGAEAIQSDWFVCWPLPTATAHHQRWCTACTTAFRHWRGEWLVTLCVVMVTDQACANGYWQIRLSDDCM